MKIASAVDLHVLQEDLGSVMSWPKRNNIGLNEQMFELMLQEACTEGSGASLMPLGNQVYAYDVSNGFTLSSTDELRDLGATMLAGLSWKVHIKKIVSMGHSSGFRVMSVHNDDAGAL